jgi:hypothetical protein
MVYQFWKSRLTVCRGLNRNHGRKQMNQVKTRLEAVKAGMGRARFPGQYLIVNRNLEEPKVQNNVTFKSS